MWDVLGLRNMNAAMNSKEKWWASRQVGDKGGLGGSTIKGTLCNWGSYNHGQACGGL